MEGSPLSPSSPNTQNTFSSLWGTQDQDMEKQTDKSQSDDQQVAAQKDHATEAVEVSKYRAENVHILLENGATIPLRSETPVDEVKFDQNPPESEAAAVLTNGGGRGDGNSDHCPSEQDENNITGPVGATKDTGVKAESERGVTVAAFGEVPNANTKEEEEGEDEDGTLVMRAECVYITEEGDDVSGDRSSLKDQQESTLNPEGGPEVLEVIEQAVKTEGAPETSAELESEEAAELTVEAQPSSEDGGDTKGGAEPTNDAEEGTEAEGRDEKLEVPDGPQPQSPTDALEGATVSLVPVYAAAAPSSLLPETEAESKAEEAVKVEEPACKPGQFQEVLLGDPQENQSSEAGEQEALLQEVHASSLKVEPAGSNIPASSETQSPSKTSQGEKSEMPKQKTCQCCSLM
ncbi:paralemmin-3 isoform X2 [Fundulus heteroclitus]|nr:paralemmin-3 isoform X2 [Fundulus heteroclitus]XP_021179791.2 paralemmin-3 isoform X2 [Fundulus heteroclitus]